MTNPSRIAIVTVFHNSEVFFDRYVEALDRQTRLPDLVVLVDSGSADPSYLDRIKRSRLAYQLLFLQNVGFCKGNNVGYELSNGADYIFFLNPDAFPGPKYIKECVTAIENQEKVAAVSGVLRGFDIYTGLPTNTIDSTGIVQNWYGRLMDRDQGRPVSLLSRYQGFSNVQGLCGAAMFCSRNALESVSSGGMIFDESFFAYKEDIDLSWRLRSAGWSLLLIPNSEIYHCRGWKDRNTVPEHLKRLSARNEVKLYWKHHSAYVVVALFKYFLVSFLGI